MQTCNIFLGYVPYLHNFQLYLILVFSSTDATTGEILMSGRHVMMGYMGSQEKTAETVVDSKEGWLRYVIVLC